jgi:hypothetical protein
MPRHIREMPIGIREPQDLLWPVGFWAGSTAGADSIDATAVTHTRDSHQKQESEPCPHAGKTVLPFSHHQSPSV